MEQSNKFVKLILKLTRVLGFTSGVGFIIIGLVIMIWKLMDWIFGESTGDTIFQQVVIQEWFTQAMLSVLIIGMGVLIMEIKRSKKE